MHGTTPPCPGSYRRDIGEGPPDLRGSKNWLVFGALSHV
jgi:hypothetical protein